MEGRGDGDSLIRHEQIDQFWPDVIVIRIHHFQTMTIPMANHTIRSLKIDGTVLVIRVPHGCEFELTRKDDDWFRE